MSSVRAERALALWQDNGLYATFMAVSSTLGVAKTVVLAKVLGADDLGLYGLVLLVLPFGTFVCSLGVLSALNAELPQAEGRGDPGAAAVRDRALGFVLLTCLVAGAAYVAVVAASATDSRTQVALSLAALTAILTTLFDFYLIVLRSRLRLVAVSGVYAARSALTVVVTALAGALFGYSGAILAEIVALATVLLFVARIWEPDVRPRAPCWEEARGLIRLGLPLTISTAMFAVTVLADRYFVAATLPRQFGQYTFAAIVVVGWLAVHGMVSQAVTARALHAYGAGAGTDGVRARLRRSLAAVGLASAAGFPVLLLVTQMLERGPFSEYAVGLQAMPILYAGGALSLLPIYGTLLIVTRRYRLIAVATGIGALVAVAGGFVLSAGDPSINDFAWLLVVSQAAGGVATVIASELAVRRASA